MMRTYKKLLPIILSVVLAVGLCPGLAMAQSDNANNRIDLGSTKTDGLKAQSVKIQGSGLQTNKTVDEALAWAASKVGTKVGSGQCVAFVKAYYEYLGMDTRNVSGNAKDYATNYCFGWERIQGGAPQRGDILVYSISANGYGHVAIFDSSNSVYEQNYNDCLRVEHHTWGYNSGYEPGYWGIIRPNWGSSPNNDPVSFRDLSSSAITDNDGRISGWVSNSGTITEIGIYAGTNAARLNKVATNTATVAWTNFHLEYNVADYFGPLSRGNTCYWKFYVVSDGREYASPVQTFLTSGIGIVSFDTYSIGNITPDNATVGVWMSNGGGVKLSEVGMAFGSSIHAMKRYHIASNVAWTRADLNKKLSDVVGKLKPGETYYARYYAFVEGVYYYSDFIRVDLPADLRFRDGVLANVTDHDATVSAWADNTGVVTEYGLYAGTSLSSMRKVALLKKSVSWTSFYISCKLSDYIGSLESGTMYHWRLYAVSNGREYETVTGSFTTSGKPSINNASVSVSNNAFVFDGKPCNPIPTVKLNSKTLKSIKDYEFSYLDSSKKIIASSKAVNAGAYYIEVSGKGEYTGSKTVKFTIDRATLAKVSIAGVKARTYTGAKQTQTPTVKLGKKTLKKGTDYTLSYSGNVNAGKATVKVVGMGNYVGTKSATFTIAKAGISGATVAAVKAQKYTGKAVKPSPKVTFKGKTLKKGTDYTLSYKNNVKRGKATVVVTGKGNFKGTKSLAFKIA